MKLLNKFLINNHKQFERHYAYVPKSKKELLFVLEKVIEERGDNADLNDIDVSNTESYKYFSMFSKFKKSNQPKKFINGNIDWIN